MSKSGDEPVRFVALSGDSSWGTSRELLPDGTYVCHDAGGGWYLDPVTGETDLAYMGGGTQWYGGEYRRRYVEGRLRDGVPWSEWDTRGQREWLANAVEQGWAQPDGAPDSAESRGALRKQTKGAPTRPGGVVSEASSVPALLRQGDVLLIPVAGISDLGVVDPSGAVAAESALGRARAPHVPRRRERGGDPGS